MTGGVVVVPKSDLMTGRGLPARSSAATSAKLLSLEVAPMIAHTLRRCILARYLICSRIICIADQAEARIIVIAQRRNVFRSLSHFLPLRDSLTISRAFASAFA